MTGEVVEVAAFLRALHGVRSAIAIAPEAVGEVLSAEECYEKSAALPIENLGIRCAFASRFRIAILKDEGFRGPPMATVYLVEDGAAAPEEELRVAGRVYHVIGEEVMGSCASVSPTAIAVSDTFTLYPERRTDARRPSRFLLPPVPFPELLAPPWTGRFRSVVSASPSPLGDVALRRICGYDQDPKLATLVVGFDPDP